MKIPVVVTRNGVAKELTATVFGKLSPNKGKTFYTPVLTTANVEDDTKWVGQDNIFDSMNRVLRRVFADIYLDENNRNPDGTLNEDNYLSDCADFTAGFAKLGDLEDEINELQEQQQALAMDPDLVPDENNQFVGRAAEIAEEMKKVALLIKPLRAKKQSIETVYAARAAKRKEAKDKKEAAAKAAAGASVPA